MAVCKLVTLAVTLPLCYILVSGATVSTDNTTRYYVKPNDTSPCPYHPCKTLAEYALDPEQYFTSDTRIIFLPGNHLLNTTLVIGNVTQLAMIGGSGLMHGPARTHVDLPLEPKSSRVLVCTANKSGILFENVSNLFLEDLTLTGCGNVSSRCSGHSALAFIYITDLLVSGISIHNSSGVGFCGLNLLGSSTIQHSVFACNHGNAVNNEGNVNMWLFYTNCSNVVTSHQLLITSSHFLNGSNNPHMRMSSASGLGLMMECTNVAVEIENSTFVGNTGYFGGNIRITLNNDSSSFTEPVIIQNCTIVNGSAYEGGGVHISVMEQPQVNVINCSSDHLIHVLNTTFSGNTATYVGGGLYLAHVQTASFYCASLRVLVQKCAFTLNTRCQYMAAGGIALHISNHRILGYLPQGVPQAKIEIENCTFLHNTDKTNQGISAAVYVEGEYSVSISDSILLSNNCTAITAVNSEILFEGDITIQENNGSNGGGIVLCDRSHMYFKPYTSLLLVNNRANGKGGAIYAVEDCLQAELTCFFQLVTEITRNHTLLKTVNVTVMNNSAVVAGDAVYGGSIDYCYLLFGQHNGPLHWNLSSADVFDTIFNPHVLSNDTSFISSDPVGVCLCNNGTPVCDQKSKDVFVYPGQTLQLSAVAVGQRNGTVPGNVAATAMGCNIANTQEMQYIPHNTCSMLSYTILSDNRSASITLGVQGAKNSMFNPPVINLTIINCPIGFTYTQQQCKCNSHLVDRGMSCDIDSSVVHRVSPWWVGACPHNTNKETHVGIAYCTAEVGHCSHGSVNLTTNSTTIESDVQCATHRTGTACGACKPGYSLTLGGNQCRKCSNKYIPVVLSFAVGGLLLVVILTALNLTVTEGAINGVIFYANIVQLNAHLFFPALPDNPVLKVLVSIPQVFIAWLNLDVGIEMCFYDGLDAYTRTWLQFVFPIYIWVIAGAIVLLSRRYTIVARATGRHAVQVLATLFLLSFFKLLSTISASVSCLALHCEPRVIVWHPDGNIEYLRGKHIPLFVAALVAAFCIVAPYTVILVFIQCLQRINCQLISRIKPIIDAYTGPYKDKCRFWTGHLLLIRIILLFSGAQIFTHSKSLAMEYTLVACVHLLTLNAWLFRGVYRKNTLDILESSYILNLVFLSASVLYFNHLNRSGRYNIIATILLAIALLTFVGVVFFQAYRQLSGLSMYHALKTKVLRRRQIHETTSAEQDPLIANEGNRSAMGCNESEESTSAQSPAQQPVLAAMRRFDQYREPVLGFEDKS